MKDIYVLTTGTLVGEGSQGGNDEPARVILFKEIQGVLKFLSDDEKTERFYDVDFTRLRNEMIEKINTQDFNSMDLEVTINDCGYIDYMTLSKSKVY